MAFTIARASLAMAPGMMLASQRHSLPWRRALSSVHISHTLAMIALRDPRHSVLTSALTTPMRAGVRPVARVARQCVTGYFATRDYPTNIKVIVGLFRAQRTTKRIAVRAALILYPAAIEATPMSPSRKPERLGDRSPWPPLIVVIASMALDMSWVYAGVVSSRIPEVDVRRLTLDLEKRGAGRRQVVVVRHYDHMVPPAATVARNGIAPSFIKAFCSDV
jgi:hypothetical protein